MSLLRFWRPRHAPQSIPPQPKAEWDWVAGDLAKCTAPEGTAWQTAFSRLPGAPGPRGGQILRVEEVRSAHRIVWLSFRGLQPYCFPAGHFRKLRPCSSDFREQLHKRTPLKVPPALPELVE